MLELSKLENVSVTDIAKPLGCDPALAARILRYANSPIVGVTREVSTLAEAISVLGLVRVRIISLSFSLLSLESSDACPSFNFQSYWSRSLAVAVSAAGLAAHVPGLRPDEAFLAGLLSRIGQLALASGMPREYQQVLALSETQACLVLEAEERILKCRHDAIGGRLLREWNFPKHLCHAIAGEESAQPLLSSLIQAADQLAFVLCNRYGQGAGNIGALTSEVSTRLHVGADVVKLVFDQTVDQWKEYGELLDISTSDVKYLAEIEAEAREQLLSLSLAVANENDGLRTRQEELGRKALVDGLTQVANRAAFDERLALELERCRQTNQPLSLLLVDVDNFKEINDQAGHQGGDQALQTIADVLRNKTRSSDFVARYGGDEFAIILPQCPMEGATALATRVRDAVARERLCLPPIRMSVSIGVGVAKWPDRPATADELVRFADGQLYAAKRSGRDCVKAWLSTSNDGAITRQTPPVA